MKMFFLMLGTLGWTLAAAYFGAIKGGSRVTREAQAKLEAGATDILGGLLK